MKYKYNDFIDTLAKAWGVSFAEAHARVSVVIEAIRTLTLAKKRSITIPTFGTFRRVTTKGGKRNVCGRVVSVPSVHRLAFRASKHTKLK